MQTIFHLHWNSPNYIRVSIKYCIRGFELNTILYKKKGLVYKGAQITFLLVFIFVVFYLD